MHHDQRSEALTQSHTLTEQVKQFLKQNQSLATLPQTATHFHMSERSLRRKLQQHQISFRELRQEVAQELSLALLAQPCRTIEQIAQRLGYADSTSYIRAFNQWFGVSPGQYRQQQLSMSNA